VVSFTFWPFCSRYLVYRRRRDNAGSMIEQVVSSEVLKAVINIRELFDMTPYSPSFITH
jgi:hypothetical protein